MNHAHQNQLRGICPVTDAEAEAMARPGTLGDLGARIVATPVNGVGAETGAETGAAGIAAPRQVPRPAARRARRPATRRAPRPSWLRGQRPGSLRRGLIGISVAAGLAGAVLALTSLGRPGQRVGPVVVGPPAAQALSFSRHGRYIKVVVRDPVADPRRYRAEFARHHLDITLKMIPVSPSLVGTETSGYQSAGTPNFKVITARGHCYSTGGRSVCPVGVRIPLDFRGQAGFEFGRAARPGERYYSTGQVTAPGEALHGIAFRGRTVAWVLAVLSRRHITVPIFHFTSAAGVGSNLRPDQVPGTWPVRDADPWAPGQVRLWVGRP